MDVLPFNVLGEVLIHLTIQEIIWLSMVAYDINQAVSATINALTREGEDWWRRKVQKDFPDQPEKKPLPPTTLSNLLMPLEKQRSATQRKREMMSFGLRPNEVYVTIALPYIVAIRIALYGELPKLLSYLSTQVGVVFPKKIANYEVPNKALLSPNDVVFLQENGLEDVIWREIETGGKFPWLYPPGKMYLLDILMKSERMTPSLLVGATESISQLGRSDLFHLLPIIINHPNAKEHLVPIFTAASRWDSGVAAEVIRNLPPDSENAMSGMLCQAISQRNRTSIVNKLLISGASPNDVPVTGDPGEMWRPMNWAVRVKSLSSVTALVSSPLFTSARVDRAAIKAVGRSKANAQLSQLVSSLLKEGKILLAG